MRVGAGRLVRTCALIGALAAWCPEAKALDPELDVSQYAHTAWKVRDGFVPGVILAIAQTPDGYLWLGTDFGLYRFDGVRAVLWQPPSGQELPGSSITRLMVSRDGTMWIGTQKGLASWRDGRLTRYPEIADRNISALLEDRDGTIWAGEWNTQPKGRLCAIRKGAVECYGTDESLGWGALSLFEDSKGNLWVGGGGPPKFGFWHWKPGVPRFYGNAVPQCFEEDTDGGLLVGSQQGLMRLVDGKLEARPDTLPQSMRGLSVRRLLWDRQGSLWIGMIGGDLAHVHQGRTDVFTEADGLSGNIIDALFEDREGNIWVATTDGLDRFRNFTIPTWSARQGLPFSAGAAVLAGNDGAIWASVVKGLANLHQREVTIYRQQPEGGMSPAKQPVHERIDRRLPQRFYALLQDHGGRLWISSPDGLGYMEGEQFHLIPPFGTRIITSLVEDPSGDLWVQDQENGLFRIHDGRVTQHIPWEMLGHKDYGWTLAVDRFRGGLWIGFLSSVVYLKDDQVRASYSASDGLGPGKVYDLRFGPRGTLWAATEGGLSRIRDGRVLTLTSKNGLPCDTVRWSIEDNDHFVWLYMSCDLVRIARSELDAWASDPKRKVEVALFDASDGVRTVAQLNGFYPQASKAPDGRIWFAAVDGVSVIDPRHLTLNKLAPPVQIEQITAERRRYEASAGEKGDLKLPALIRDMEIEYTALSLAVPEKVQFRFKLEGWDRDWHEVGNRRQAYYADLPPRKYRFRVAASNNSGVWNEEGASLDFSVAPAYYQTLWFQVSGVAAFLLLLWGLYQMRVRQVARDYNMQLEGRVSERTRIARELHDTLLQSFQGVLLSFQGGINLLPHRPEEAKKRLQGVIEDAEHAVTEGRDAVQGLRWSTIENNNLAATLITLGEQLGGSCKDGKSPLFDVQVEGETEDLQPILRDEVYRITGEAMRNAFRHAQAKRVEVEIYYDEAQLRVRVRDDGKGMDEQVVKEKGRAGHYGLHGMHERAKLVGGKLELWSKEGAGTEVEVSVPAAIAYESAKSRKWAWFFGKETKETKVEKTE